MNFLLYILCTLFLDFFSYFILWLFPTISLCILPILVVNPSASIFVAWYLLLSLRPFLWGPSTFHVLLCPLRLSVSCPCCTFQLTQCLGNTGPYRWVQGQADQEFLVPQNYPELLPYTATVLGEFPVRISPLHSRRKALNGSKPILFVISKLHVSD